MNKPFPNRQSIRLKKYDYSQPRYYFITICTKNREYLFGEITVRSGSISDRKMNLSDAGKMVLLVWDQIPQFYNGIQIDEFIIMPNHIHGIIQITPVGAGPRACPRPRACPINNDQLQNDQPQHDQPQHGQPQHGQPRGVAPTGLSLSDVVQRFKTMTTKKYTDGVKQYDWKPFPGKLWQRNYWEHIIRNENELNHIRDYIRYNPQKWDMDKLKGGIGNKVMETCAGYGNA